MADVENIDHPHGAPVSPVIVLLAAGESRRFGAPKQLAIINGETMIHRCACQARGTGVPVLVVTGAHADKIAAALSGLSIRMVHNSRWTQGMGSSLATGIRAVQRLWPQASGALICVADQPLLSTAMLATLLQRHRENPAYIVATDHAGHAGTPAFFPCHHFDILAQWQGHAGAQALLRDKADNVQLCPILPGIDVDTPQDLQQVRQLLSNHGLSNDGRLE